MLNELSAATTGKSFQIYHLHHFLMREKCNCKNENECPLERKCMMKEIVYNAEITAKDNGEMKEYIGMTSTTFKERFSNHLKSFNSSSYANETRLSKYVWELKKKNRPYDIKWSILKHCPAYKAGENHCSFCSTENSLL